MTVDPLTYFLKTDRNKCCANPTFRPSLPAASRLKSKLKCWRVVSMCKCLGDKHKESLLWCLSSCLPPLPLCAVDSSIFPPLLCVWGSSMYCKCLHCITQKREVELSCSVSLFSQISENTLETFASRLRSNTRLDYSLTTRRIAALHHSLWVIEGTETARMVQLKVSLNQERVLASG